MGILAYGEDALTLWALRNRLDQILSALQDDSDPAECQAFYRPSFGRSGGPDSAQFGEFDFILLSELCVYLGESKWDGSSERIVNGVLKLRDEQLLRHRLMKFYIAEWTFRDYADWQQFEELARPKLLDIGIEKPIAPADSLLASNLMYLLDSIRGAFNTVPAVKNLLLYLHSGNGKKNIPRQAGKDFDVVALDYSDDLHGRFIPLD